MSFSCCAKFIIFFALKKVGRASHLEEIGNSLAVWQLEADLAKEFQDVLPRAMVHYFSCIGGACIAAAHTRDETMFKPVISFLHSTVNGSSSDIC